MDGGPGCMPVVSEAGPSVACSIRLLILRHFTSGTMSLEPLPYVIFPESPLVAEFERRDLSHLCP